ncbi:unnamed protein product [Boreogadus saida]
MLLDHDVINLLRYLWERNVLNEEEKRTVEGKMTSKDRARCLIDTVMEKGKRESSLMVDYLTERRPELCSALGLNPTSALIKLGRNRSKLVDLLLDHDVINLLRYLWEMNVLNDEEKKTVEEKMTSEDGARCLIDTVMKKGERESSVMVDYLTEKPPELWPTLGLTPTSALIKLGSIRCKLVNMLSDHDVIKLLRCLWEINVFNDKQKKTVEEKTNREAKASCLIYTVMGKEATASSLMVDYLTEKHPELCLTLGLTPTSALIKLGRIRSKFVNMLSHNDFINLLHNLRKMNVLNDEEKKTVEGKKTTEDGARCLIDTVMGKGATPSRLTVDYLTKRHPELCSTLDPTQISAQIKLGRMGSKLFCMLSDHDVINLLHYLREMNVLNDEEEKTVEGKTNREDKACCLIDTVLEKGESASSLMVDYLTERHPELRIGFGGDPSFSSRQESPGLMSPSLPLEIHEGDSKLGNISDQTVGKPRKSKKGVGHISDKTVVKRRNQNKGELQRIHSEFVKTVKISVIRGLLDDLLQQKVFSTQDKDSVMEKGKIKTDMARCLIDMVIRKGEKASRIMIDSMKKRDPDLCSTLGLISSPAGVGQISDKTVVKPRTQNKGELRRIRSEFVKTVKISVIRGLLDDLLQQKVFSTQDKDSVMEKGKIKTDMARCLIDMVIRKGEKASRIMIDSMKKRDPDLCSTLGLISSPAGVGNKGDQTLVKPRKQNKGNEGRKRRRSESEEEVAKKKSSTVDGSDISTETCSTGQTLSDKELLQVAKTLGQEWEQVALHLELKNKDLEDIKAEHGTVAMQKQKMLVIWSRRRPQDKATAQDLLRGLEDLEDLPLETRQLLTGKMKK